MLNSVLVIGLGKVSTGFDGNKYFIEYSKFQNHCYSIIKTKFLKLAGGVDKKKNNRDFFYKHYNSPVFSNIHQAINIVKPNIILVAVNTKNQIDVLQKILKNKNIFLKVIIIEKPMGSNLKEALKIKKIFFRSNIKIFINYIRNYDSKLVNFLKKNINKKKFYYIKVFYSGNFLNNASHFISLFNLFFSKIKKLKVTTISSYKNIKCKVFYKNSIIEYSHFKMNNKHCFTLLGSNISIFYDNMRSFLRVAKSSIYNYQIESMYGQKILYKNVVNYLNKKKYFSSSVSDAIEVHKLIKKIISLK